VIGVLRHDGNAFFAAATAALNSSFVVKGTCETTSCVAYHIKQYQYQKHTFLKTANNKLNYKLNIKKKNTYRVYNIYESQ